MIQALTVSIGIGSFVIAMLEARAHNPNFDWRNVIYALLVALAVACFVYAILAGSFGAVVLGAVLLAAGIIGSVTSARP